VYAEDEQLFFKDFAEAFGELLALGCPAHCQRNAPVPKAPGSTPDKDFRDLAMHGSVERMKEIAGSSGGVDVNSVEQFSGRTAAHKAAFFGHANVIAYLASMNANLNAVDSDGDTPLHDAARFGHVAVIQELLKAGADKSIKNKDEKLPLQLAAANGKEDVVTMLVG